MEHTTLTKFLLISMRERMNKPFYETFDTLYHFFTDAHPQLEPISPIVSFGMAYPTTYILTRGLQATSRYVVDKMLPGFHEKALPKLERLCQIGIPVAVGAGALFSSEVRDVLTTNTTFLSGWAGIYAGGFVAVEDARDLRKWKKEINYYKK